MELFKQCQVTRCVDGKVERLITWIPESLAVPGAMVCMKDPDEGVWTEGWTVMAVSEPGWPVAFLVRHRDEREVLVG